MLAKNRMAGSGSAVSVGPSNEGILSITLCQSYVKVMSKLLYLYYQAFQALCNFNFFRLYL